MKINPFKFSLFFLLLILPLIITTTALADEKSTEEPAQEPIETPGHVIFAANVFELNLDFDTTLDIQGDTRFFSSRHNKYVGGRITAHVGDNTESTFYRTTMAGFVWGKSSFLMNWEEPGLISFDPLESAITTYMMPIGMSLNLNLGGFLRISPYFSAKMMLLHMSLEIGDEDFSDNAFKVGIEAGLRVSLVVGEFGITAGAGLTHILNGEIEFELDDSVTFMSRTSGSSPEYFLGLEL